MALKNIGSKKNAFSLSLFLLALNINIKKSKSLQLAQIINQTHTH